MSKELNKIMSKCDELESKDYNNGMTAYELMEENGLVNTAKAVKEVIAELKARIQLDDDEMAGFLDLEEECGGGDLRNYITELKRKLEDVQATAYAEMVDAGMRERRLKRALWLERARRASAWQIHFALSHNHSIKREFTINGASSPHDRMVTMRTARDWAMIWKNVERECRAKAEEYK